MSRLLDAIRPYLYIAPAMITFFLFFLYPIGYMIYLSFTSWNLINPVKEFVGIENYTELLADPDFHIVMAGNVILVLPILLVFFLAQRQIIRAFVYSGVK